MTGRYSMESQVDSENLPRKTEEPMRDIGKTVCLMALEKSPMQMGTLMRGSLLMGRETDRVSISVWPMSIWEIGRMGL